MKSSIVGSAAAIIMASLTACRPDGTAPTERRDISTSKDIRREAVHEGNPHDWVGQLHNEFVRRAAYELRQPNTKTRDLCSRMKSWIKESPEFSQLLPESARSMDRAKLSASLGENPICTRLGNRRVGAAASRLVSHRALTSAVEELGAEAQGLIEDVAAELANASDPSDLASGLSPILSAASGLGANDAAAVESQASMAQSSYEEWYYGGLQDLADPIEADMDDCIQGQYENQSYELDGITYICMNSSWHQARNPRSNRQPLQLRFASLTLGSTQGCSLNSKGVAEDDLLASTVALYAAVQSGYFFTNPPVVLGEIAVFSAGVSVVSAVAASIDYIRCIFNIS